MIIRESVVELLLDVDVQHNAHIPFHDWTHLDGRRLTADEFDTVAAATPEEWRAALERDMDRRRGTR